MSFLSQPLFSLYLGGGQRTVAGIKVNVIMTESTSDKLQITQQPVQQGAPIADHAFKLPTELSMTAYFNANAGKASLASIYQQLLKLQNTLQPFIVVTPKRTYKNMLFSALGVTTDGKTENCLAVTMSFQQVIIVQTSSKQVSRSVQANPGATGATQPAGKQSALSVLVNGPITPSPQGAISP